MLCPECKGSCCRDIDTKYRTTHMGAEVYEHCCDACHDGSVPQPDPRDVLINKLREAIATWPKREHHYTCYQVDSPREPCVCSAGKDNELRANARRLVGLED
jgi:hypothetical protein